MSEGTFSHVITKTRRLKYIENFTTTKSESFPIKILIFFHISAQKIDCNEYLQSIF